MQVRAELRPLTAIRGIAAWFVVLYHVRISTSSLVGPDLTAIFARGYLAVDFFFMLSGFVIWLNYAERLRADGLKSAPLFLWRRLARVYPLHLFMLGGALLFVTAHIATGKAAPANFPLNELPLHLLLVQNWGFTDRLSWNDPAWSISCEFAAYLLFPLLALCVDWRKWPSLLLLAGIALLLLLLHGIMLREGHRQLGADLTHLGLVRCFTQFVAGSMLCALWMRWRHRPAVPAAIASAIAIAAFGMFLRGGAETLFVPAAFAGLLLAVALTAEHPRHPLGGKLIHYLGEISYATYLVHFLLFVAFKLAFVSDARDLTLMQLLAFLALTLAASSALYHFVERPSQRWLNGLVRASVKQPRPSRSTTG